MRERLTGRERLRTARGGLASLLAAAVLAAGAAGCGPGAEQAAQGRTQGAGAEAGSPGETGSSADGPGRCDWPLESSTATSSVSMFDCALAMPQLDRGRRVWVYLPPDYETGEARFPVLYMHDGQNVFDAATSYAGEWGVDEALDSLHAAGDPGVIVVAVANGEELRLDEYSPWVNPDMGEGGEGEAYVRFLAETLKPAIDAAYRTLPGREHTGIAGSSMGGLISLYAALERPDVFGAVGIFSPAFWFAPAVYDSVAGASFPEPTRIYMVTGGREGDDPETYVRGHERMVEALRSAGFHVVDPNAPGSPGPPGSSGSAGAAAAPERPGLALAARVREDGTHSEGSWRSEFPAAYGWLYER